MTTTTPGRSQQPPFGLETLGELLAWLDRPDPPDCTHRLEESTAFLTERGVELEPALAWLRDQGGVCDCEIVHRMLDQWGSVAGYVPPDEDDEPTAMVRALTPLGRSGWAIASGYLGLLSILLVPGPFAIVTGVLGLREIQANPKLHGKVRCWFGILCGLVASLLLVAALLQA